MPAVPDCGPKARRRWQPCNPTALLLALCMAGSVLAGNAMSADARAGDPVPRDIAPAGRADDDPPSGAPRDRPRPTTPERDPHPPRDDPTTPAPRTEGRETAPPPASAPSLPPPPATTLSRRTHDADAEPGEVMVVSPDMPSAQVLDAAAARHGLRVIRRQPLNGLGLVLSTFRSGADQDTQAMIEALQEAHPELWIDANHHYRLQADRHAPRHYARALIAWPDEPERCRNPLRLGMIDTGLRLRHAALQGQNIHTRSFLPAGSEGAPADHGNAVAALLVGAANSQHRGLLPHATLYAAAVFEQRGERTLATGERIVLAMDWLAGHAVAAVNLSLTGPPNRILELALTRAQQAGITVVAAAGNEGPRAPPAFPAAYPGTVAVTAVDARLTVFRHANRGDYIDFAAPGVDIWTAAADGGAYRSGTSIATAFVTAGLALADFGTLQRHARTLGETGRDPVFGYGLLQLPDCP